MAPGRIATILFAWSVSALALAQAAPSPKVPERLARARSNVQQDVEALFRAAKVTYPPAEIFLRAIKDEDVLELWAASKVRQSMTLVKTYRVCARSGDLGPKRERGDGQVPEGFYFVDRFNAWSSFHLSLGIDYPNASDRLRKTGADPGGDIFIHGGCATIGCLPIEDGPIEELFVIATDARTRRISVHLFPFRLTEERLNAVDASNPNKGFWVELGHGYRAFEETLRPPRVQTDAQTGVYALRQAARPQPQAKATQAR